VKSYQKTTTYCTKSDENKSFACDAMVLGCILKGCSNIFEDFLASEATYAGQSFEQVFKNLTALEIMSPCDTNSYYHPLYPLAHGLKRKIDVYLEAINERLNGLDL
jgi:hypothetical protein